MKYIRIVLSENSHFLVVNFSIYLNRRVFVMLLFCVCVCVCVCVFYVSRMGKCYTFY